MLVYVLENFGRFGTDGTVGVHITEKSRDPNSHANHGYFEAGNPIGLPQIYPVISRLREDDYKLQLLDYGNDLDSAAEIAHSHALGYIKERVAKERNATFVDETRWAKDR